MKFIKEYKLEIIVISVMMWIMTTNVIQAFKCPEMSQTELFIHLPKSFILNFKNCK
jgi:hypothetical protein